ncbi:uncharacterized protein [Macrobrachium rosenbergii]|uniref:uncharacterized protein isoform X2 n=1 Tax=Macrobrachium rosenbergii TaxID=79674 RepID=UPI0034D5501A
MFHGSPAAKNINLVRVVLVLHNAFLLSWSRFPDNASPSDSSLCRVWIGTLKFFGVCAVITVDTERFGCTHDCRLRDELVMKRVPATPFLI